MFILIIFMMLVMGFNMFAIYPKYEPEINNDYIDVTERETFNAPIAQYEGKQNGTATKALLSHLTSNAGTYAGIYDRLPQIIYNNTNGESEIDAELTDIKGTDEEYMTKLMSLRSSILSTHQYEISVEYDKKTEIINKVIIAY